jgi:phospholipid/cholesterol/gamma-HCH transport system substrate-binding protein
LGVRSAARCAALSALAVLALGGCGGGRAYEVRAIFDNASNVIPGEDVKVAGVKVGQVAGLHVTGDKRAAIVLRIDDPGFRDFRADARCTIRVQSLIGEKFVDCTPSQPREPGAPLAAPLPAIPAGRPGAGQHLLGVTQTSSPVDQDLLQDILRVPERQRLSIILNELGTGLAGRGQELHDVIRRADPALRETDLVLGILAAQDRTLAKLATDADRTLAPLTRQRTRFADSFVQIGRLARATAQRRAALAEDIRRLPAFLRELSPTMDQLGALADKARPTLANLHAAAPGINDFAVGLKPLVTQAQPFFESLGRTARHGRTTVTQSRPAVDALATLAAQARPTLRELGPLLASVRSTGGIERFMDLVYNSAGAFNGFDSAGHYVRGALILNTCSTYAVSATPGCDAHLGQDTAPTSAKAARAGGSTASLLDYLLAP